MKKAIVIGATSGIGKELARILHLNGYAVGMAGRRTELLRELQGELPGSRVREIDVSEADEAMTLLKELIREMGGMDLAVISSGVGFVNPGLYWKREKETIDINVSGFAAVAGAAFKHFSDQGSGHIVGISSIAALRGSSEAPAYNASKAFVSNYLEGLRQKAIKSGAAIAVTDIRPGFVDTAMMKGKGLFWVSSPETAAMQIYQAIERKKKRAYVTKRWSLIALALRIMPDWIYDRF